MRCETDCRDKSTNCPACTIQSLREAQKQLVEALKVAHDHITGPFGPLGEHRDNPVPSLLREAMLRAEEEK